jgi:hypothetical protein
MFLGKMPFRGTQMRHYLMVHYWYSCPEKPFHLSHLFAGGGPKRASRVLACPAHPPLFGAKFKFCLATAALIEAVERRASAKGVASNLELIWTLYPRPTGAARDRSATKIQQFGMPRTAPDRPKSASQAVRERVQIDRCTAAGTRRIESPRRRVRWR